MVQRKSIGLILLITLLISMFSGIPSFALEEGGGSSPSDVSVILDKSCINLSPGQDGTITATVITEQFSEKGVEATSSDSTIATVTNNDYNATEGKTSIIVKALKAGTATITVLSKADDTKVKTCTITVDPNNFSEDFNDGKLSDWNTYGDSNMVWSASTGALAVNAGGGYKAVNLGTDFDNFIYESDISISGGANNDNAGLIFRVSNPTAGADNLKGYYAGIRNGNTVQIGRFNNNWKELASVYCPINPNTTYRLKVIVNGSRIDVYVDNKLIASANDDMWTHGAIGSRTWNVNAKFDNISVQRIIPVTNIESDKNALTLDAIGEDTLTASVIPESATFKKVHFTSNNPNVTLSNEVYNEANKTTSVTVKALNTGTEAIHAAITATAEDPAAITKVIDVTVNAPKDQGAAYQAKVAAAEAAVVKAEASKNQTDVDYARTLVIVLNDPEKTNLGIRIDAVQEMINSTPVYHGLKGDYYTTTSNESADFKTLVATYADENIDFYNNFTGIFTERVGRSEGVAVRWTGKIEPKYNENYTFYLVGDNGFRLWIDDKLVIDHWVNDYEVPQTSIPVKLTAGTKHNIKLEYFQAIGGADLRLEWSSASQSREIIPPDRFYQPDGSTLAIVSSIDAVTINNSQQYSRPALPAKVTVHYSDGTAKEVFVKWNLSDMSIFNQLGEVTVTGKITGSNVPAVAKVNVVAYTHWEKQQASIMTQWSDEITSSTIPFENDYPRMQMKRSDWLNLNGLWQFQGGSASDAVPVGTNLNREIMVPYPMESALSGVMMHYDRAWYKRTFTVPENWQGKKIQLNFGAVDWEAEVYINGHSMGVHKGGYDSFNYDITPYLKDTGEQELIVRVYDPTDAVGNPRGKQTLNPGGIMYTSTSGIWQTVWMEPVSDESSIDSLQLVPDLDGQRLKITVKTAGAAEGTTVTAVAKDGTAIAGTVSGDANTELYIPIQNPKLWSPENPFLYDLEVRLEKGSTTLDTVESYFGMRKISVETKDGYKKIFLNNKETFLMGPLDQGFWPDGLYTAPTDEALKYDIVKEKELGFNMVRKHIKVEPQRWYYWADKLGIMVWQDMPSENSYVPGGQYVPPLEKTQYEAELKRMVESHYNSPSIILWCVFNENQGQYEPERLVNFVKSLDSTRLINQGSGDPRVGAGDMEDIHSYPPPAYPKSISQVRVNGEYGGIGLKVDGHLWNPSSLFYYTMVNNGEELADVYESYADLLLDFKTNHGLSAAVYTEITDVEIELNGLMTYDRKVMKADASRIREINQNIINKLSSVTEILPTSKTQPKTWKYTTTSPAQEWNSTSFDDTSWSSGSGGFGGGNPPNISIGTAWNTNDIWMRTTFNPGSLTSDDINSLSFNIFYDEDCEIYINGVLAGTATGYTTNYVKLTMNDDGKKAIIPNADNVIAVHVHQTTGGQGIDVGIAKFGLMNSTKSSNADLSDLKVGGTTIPAFHASTTSYAVELPEGTTAVPEVTAEAADIDHATIVVTQPLELPGSAVVSVTAEDGTVKTYTIAFTVIQTQTPGATTASLDGIAQTTPGQTFDLSYALSSSVTNTTYFAQDITVSYDADKLEYINATSLNEQCFVLDQMETPGQVRIITANPGGAAANEALMKLTLMKLTFKAKGLTESASAAVSLSKVIAADGNGMESEIEGGSHTILIKSVDKTALAALILHAQSNHDAAVEGSRNGQYPVGSKALLQAAIDQASAVAANESASQDDVDQAVTVLNTALQTFVSSVNTSTPGDVNGDDRYSVGDLALVAVNYGKDSTDSSWQQIKAMDINGDGVINLLDLAAVASKILNVE
ncbi:PA14 domain-containing protein [Paenibacillus hexagrammi]|uniref:PA14 domain-containing protein n=1 Tax=Paenibacillus hexagrammi TaxID=2908839 RepID=A0ABY3SQ12_9BACL|nr:PA14 domain-containing protein [Paenibacillus sp. YPD9-1]UJF35548.1 PA14 domain-containing protein [Paenibacillus sp. YPD9-1]